MKHVAEHFNTEADIFDARVVKIVPYYREMLEALVNSLPFPTQKRIKVLDLGCGTGTISRLVKQRFPMADIQCVDLVPNMLALAREKLRGLSGIEFEQADLHHYAIPGTYDAVVTSLALHHLETDADKLAMHRKIFRSLTPGGVFASADITVSSKKFLQQHYMQKWEEFISRSFSQDQIENNYQRYRREDRPSILLDELSRLMRIGFSPVEILWKYYNFTTYAAYKPKRSKP